MHSLREIVDPYSGIIYGWGGKEGTCLPEMFVGDNGIISHTSPDLPTVFKSSKIKNGYNTFIIHLYKLKIFLPINY